MERQCRVNMSTSTRYQIELNPSREGGIHCVRLVIADCKANRPYLYTSDSDEFMSETDLIAFARECDQ